MKLNISVILLYRNWLNILDKRKRYPDWKRCPVVFKTTTIWCYKKHTLYTKKLKRWEDISWKQAKAKYADVAIRIFNKGYLKARNITRDKNISDW